MNKGRKHRRGGRNRHKGKAGGGGGEVAEPEAEVEGQDDGGGPTAEETAAAAAVAVNAASSAAQVAAAAGVSVPQEQSVTSKTAGKPRIANLDRLTDDPDVIGGLILPEGDRAFVVKNSDIMGRYIVAARDLQPAEVIICEEPLVVGPSQAFKPFCLGCYQRIEDDGRPPYRCEACGWPLCGRACRGRGAARGHSAAECAAWAAAGLRQRPPPAPLAFQAVMALRCLLLRDADPAAWRRLCQMESHNEIRRKLPELWRHNQAVIVDRIREDWKMADRFTEEEIHTVCGILEVNSFEVGQHGTRALFPTAFLLAHDCVPNTSHSDDTEGFALTVRAAHALPRGQPITLSYAYTLQGTLKRREHLRESKFFECTCARCADPTELGTLTSALKCSKCPRGFLLSPAPLDADVPWRCGAAACGFVLDAHSVRLLVDRIFEELETVDANNVPALEAFLKKYRNVLHSHHYLALSAKHSLAQLYGKAQGYTIHELSDELLARKRDICRELLRVFDVLEPGQTRLRGVCLYELHAPLLILATRGFEARAITPKDLASRLKEVVACLEEAARILALEPDTSTEGIMGQAAADALLRMRDWHRAVDAL